MAEKTREEKQSQKEEIATEATPDISTTSGVEPTDPGSDAPDEHALFLQQPALTGREIVSQDRVSSIRESHTLLGQFSPKELKTLLSLKRNTSAKAWTLREDLVVLTLPLSNREIADLLKDRNKEAVKKRLQLLRSKGLVKRSRETAPPIKGLSSDESPPEE